MARKKRFIEESNRTTIVGITAIVVIVLATALFIQLHYEPVSFDGVARDASGLAAQTFEGVRHVQLEEREALRGHLSAQGYDRTYYVYLEEDLLVVDHGDRQVQAVLEEYEGTAYTTTYEDRERDVDVLINPSAKQLFVQGLLDVELPPLQLSRTSVYEGALSVAGDDYSFTLVGTTLEITTGDERSQVALSRSDGLLRGEWDEREVILNPQEQVLIIHEIY